MRNRKCDKERRGIEKIGKEKRRICLSSEEKYLIFYRRSLRVDNKKGK